MIAQRSSELCSLRCTLYLLGLLAVATAQHPVHQQLASSSSLTFAPESSSSASAGSNSSQPQEPSSMASTLYMSAQASKLRVNVSNICEKNQMRVTIRLNRPFYGLIHTKDKRRKPACTLEGTGEQAYTMEISYTLVQSEAAHCGVVSHQMAPGSTSSVAAGRASQQQAANQSSQGQTLSVALVVRLHKTIEFSDDRYFLLSCANRCARSDCSTRDDQPASGLSRVSSGRSIVTSESVLAPTRSTGSQPLEANRSNRLLGEGSGVDWTTERCDVMLDLKFQWLVKLCWILATLLLLTFCTAYYLCVALNRAKSKLTQLKKCTRKPTLSKSTSKQILYPQSSQSESMSWSAATNSTSDELIDKIREDNSYLAKQHQQLMLANMLAKSQPLEQQDGQTMCNLNASDRHIIMGRPADLFAINSENQRRQLEARVKRRRSIGGSKGLADLSHEHMREVNCKLDANQKAKSRSQTTIHYDQRQDPFETVPFSYLGSGYISDGATSQREYLAPNSIGLDVYGQPVHNVNEVQAPYSGVQNHHLLVEAHVNPGDPSLMRRNNVCQPQRWASLKNPVPPPPRSELVQISTINGHVGQQQQQQQISSQFDPKNSRHLIDMIQHKHRQQIAQANRTAASIQDIHLSQPNLSRQGMQTQARAWR